MARFEWLAELLARFADEHILVYCGSRTQRAPAHLLHIDPEDWALATREIARYGCRWCALWAEQRPSDNSFLMNACYEQFGDYVVLRTQISITQPLVILSTELTELELILNRHSGLKDRLATTGILSSEQARQLGCLGHVGRASGQNYDLRRDSAYPPYDQFPIEVAVHTAGDVEARLHVRLAEIRQSLRLLQAFLLSRLPQEGAYRLLGNRRLNKQKVWVLSKAGVVKLSLMYV